MELTQRDQVISNCSIDQFWVPPRQSLTKEVSWRLTVIHWSLLFNPVHPQTKSRSLLKVPMDQRLQKLMKFSWKGTSHHGYSRSPFKCWRNDSALFWASEESESCQIWLINFQIWKSFWLALVHVCSRELRKKIWKAWWNYACYTHFRVPGLHLYPISRERHCTLRFTRCWSRWWSVLPGTLWK